MLLIRRSHNPPKRGAAICALQPCPFGRVPPPHSVAGVRRLPAFCVCVRFRKTPFCVATQRTYSMACATSCGLEAVGPRDAHFFLPIGH
jgi:hypothetical protein